MALLQQLSQLMKDAVSAKHLPGIAPVSVAIGARAAMKVTHPTQGRGSPRSTAGLLFSTLFFSASQQVLWV
jgi:hypothetical protein